MDRTSNDDDHCDDDVHCDSGTLHFNDGRYKPNKADDDHYDSGAHKPKNSEDIRYKPNTSRRRQSLYQQRKPCADDPTILRGHMESIEPVGKPKNDWKELWGLSCNLIFEILKLVLSLSLTIVWIGSAFMESVGKGISWWLEEEMPRVLERGHKE